MPKRLVVSMSGSHVFRFVSSGLSTTTVTNVDILGLLGVATSATGVTALFASARVRQITMYAPSSSTSVLAMDVTWKGMNYVKPVRTSDVALCSTQPGMVRSRPPKGADAGNWFSFAAGTQTLFLISGPATITVDVHVDYVLANATALGTVATYVSSGLTAGYVYFGYLDKNTGAPKLIPSDVVGYG